MELNPGVRAAMRFDRGGGTGAVAGARGGGTGKSATDAAVETEADGDISIARAAAAASIAGASDTPVGEEATSEGLVPAATLCTPCPVLPAAAAAASSGRGAPTGGAVVTSGDGVNGLGPAAGGAALAMVAKAGIVELPTGDIGTAFAVTLIIVPATGPAGAMSGVPTSASGTAGAGT